MLATTPRRACRACSQEVGLPGVESKRCEELSKGMLQRVQFLGAIIHQPDLLILDEPFSGQDPVSVRILREQILEEHRRGATVLLSTHVMANAEEMCQHVVMIHQGRKVLDEPMSGLRRQFDPRTIHFEPLDANANPSSLSGMSGVERVESVDGDLSNLADAWHRSRRRHGAAGSGGCARTHRAGASQARGRLRPHRGGRGSTATLCRGRCAPA